MAYCAGILRAELGGRLAINPAPSLGRRSLHHFKRRSFLIPPYTVTLIPVSPAHRQRREQFLLTAVNIGRG